MKMFEKRLREIGEMFMKKKKIFLKLGRNWNKILEKK